MCPLGFAFSWARRCPWGLDKWLTYCVICANYISNIFWCVDKLSNFVFSWLMNSPRALLVLGWVLMNFSFKLSKLDF